MRYDKLVLTFRLNNFLLSAACCCYYFSAIDCTSILVPEVGADGTGAIGIDFNIKKNRVPDIRIPMPPKIRPTHFKKL